MYMNM